MRELKKELRRGRRLKNILFAIKREKSFCRITAKHGVAENRSAQTSPEKNE